MMMKIELPTAAIDAMMELNGAARSLADGCTTKPPIESLVECSALERKLIIKASPLCG